MENFEMSRRTSMLRSLLLCLLVSSAGARPAASGAEHGLEGALALLDQGMSTWQPSAFEAPIRQLTEICRTSAEPAPWYWSAVAQFHRLLCLRSAQGDAAGAELVEETVRTLDRALVLKPQDAECHVMRGALNGMKIARQPAAALWLGGKVLADQRQALEFGRGNPRVRYLNGISIYRASKGKDAEKALKELLEAETLFQAESQQPSVPLAPRWGYDHCLFLIGEVYEAEKNSAKATEYYGKALSQNPQLERARLALRRITGS